MEEQKLRKGIVSIVERAINVVDEGGTQDYQVAVCRVATLVGEEEDQSQYSDGRGVSATGLNQVQKY